LAVSKGVDCERIEVFEVYFPHVVVSPFVLFVLVDLPFDERVDFLGIGFSSVNSFLPLVDIVSFLV
jgi:hypothetical protein